MVGSRLTPAPAGTLKELTKASFEAGFRARKCELAQRNMHQNGGYPDTGFHALIEVPRDRYGSIEELALWTNAIGVDMSGIKHVLDIWVQAKIGANFCRRVREYGQPQRPGCSDRAR